MRDELTFNASDNEDAPESPTSFPLKVNKTNNKGHFHPKRREVSVELTLNVSDNEETPELPILLLGLTKLVHSVL